MGAPDEFHEDAHPEATEITGERRYGEWGQCIATAKSHGGRCGGYAQGPHGKCNRHGGAEGSGAPEGNSNAEGNAGGDGAEEGNTRAVTHGAYADQSTLYSDVFDDAERALADEIFEDYRTRYLEAYGDIPTGHKVRLFKIAVNAVTEIRVENWVNDRPEVLETGTPHIDSEQHFTEDGRQYFKYKKSPALAAKKTLSNENRKWLKDLGLLDDPESQKADAIDNAADSWRDFINS